MANAVEVTVRVADLRVFKEFLDAAAGVIRAFDASPGLGVEIASSVETLRTAMVRLAEGDS